MINGVEDGRCSVDTAFTGIIGDVSAVYQSPVVRMGMKE